MKNRIFLCAALAVIVLASGCKSKDAQVVGKWNGPGGVALTFNQDKTFLQGGAMPTTGTWTLSDKKVSIKVEKVGGKTPTELLAQIGKMLPADKLAEVKKQLDNPIDLTLSDDAKSLSLKSPQGQTVTLTKEETKS